MLRAGISKTNLYRWFRQTPFANEVERVRERVVTEALAKIRGAASIAVDSLLVILEGAQENTTRLRAVGKIIDLILKLKEQEIENRLAAIEKYISERRSHENEHGQVKED